MTTASRRAGGFALALATLAALLPATALADFKVRSPQVEEGEIEVEHNGSYTHDQDRTKANATSTTYEVGAGLTSWWLAEFELEAGRDAGDGERTRFQATTFENTFQLTEPGEYWATMGFFGEFSNALKRGVADSIELGPLVEKDIGRTTHTMNLLFSKEIGPNHEDSGIHFNYAWQSRWNWMRQISPALEIYGEPGRIDHFSGFQNQELRVGPTLLGSFLLNRFGKLNYNVGYLFGATRGTSDGAVKWQLEWEMHL